jgi:hypothetical protein
MAAAGCQSFKDARLRCCFVEMERLWVKLGGKLFDPRRFHHIAS